jgi:hypothetical protein
MLADRRELAAIFAGGFIGAVARAGLVEAFPPDPGRWPWATFVANIAGAALLGYVSTRLQERLPLSSYRRPLLGMADAILAGAGGYVLKDGPAEEIAAAIRGAAVGQNVITPGFPPTLLDRMREAASRPLT